MPSGRRGTVPAGTTVLDAARALGVDVDSVCGGRGLCGRCQVTLGERPGLPADPGRLSPPSLPETGYAGRRPLAPGHRLACAAQVLADVVVDVPEASQVHRQVVRKEAGRPDVAVDPVLRLHYVELPEPILEQPTGDAERLAAALAAEWGLADVRPDHHVLVALQPALDAGHREVTVAVRDGREVVAVWPGLRDAAHGVAVDVGSTTLAAHLCDLASGAVLASAGRMNPQIAYGEDLMSRVSYAMLEPGGAARLTAAVREALAGLVVTLCEDAGISPEDVLELTMVGNPVMHHLVLGLDPTRLGSAPFALATSGAVTVAASTLGLGVHRGARVYLPPCVAGHVGADAAAMVLAEGPHRSDALLLCVDVGTNAEIVLGDRHRVLAASSPTGPAFEGAQISGGRRAAPGAVERVRIDRATYEPRVRVIGVDAWSDEPEFARRSRRAGVTGICGSGIIEAVAELYLAGVVGSDGTIRPVDSARMVPEGRTWGYRLWEDPEIVVRQADVRAVQLAKAALQAGCRLLLDRAGVDEVDEVRLTGAFGSHIDPLYAAVLGLVPDCDLDRIRSVGNSAGRGSLMVLLSAAARREVEEVTGRVEKVETAVEPRFQEHFVAALGFPHGTFPSPHLASRVALPPPVAPPARGRRRSGGEAPSAVVS
ncbi:ASKHA domain-containing protein [Phycicoccus flavus]|nr:ASKHA domain-containing protein [Phycicoccus flavus]